MNNQIQLCTYADRLGGNLNALSRLLDGPFEGLFGGVHILPFFNPIDGTDAGSTRSIIRKSMPGSETGMTFACLVHTMKSWPT